MTQPDSNSTPQGHSVQANGLNIYYEEYGSGEPLILLHGGTVTSQMWQPFLSSFVPHFRVLTPDSRAHGKTNNPGGELGYPLMADDIVAFMRALHLTRPLIFGYSDGGQIALEIGMRYPGLAAAFIVGAAWRRLGTSCARFGGFIWAIAVSVFKLFSPQPPRTRAIGRLLRYSRGWLKRFELQI